MTDIENGKNSELGLSVNSNTETESSETNSLPSLSTVSVESKSTTFNGNDEEEKNCVNSSEHRSIETNKMKNRNLAFIIPELELAEQKEKDPNLGSEDNFNVVISCKAIDGNTHSKDQNKEPTSPLSFVKKYAYQFRIMACLSLLYATTSSAVTFPSILIADMLEHNTTVYGTYITFSDTEQDSIGSFLNIGSAIGVLSTATLMGIIGRKKTFGFLTIIAATAWLGIALSPNPTLILVFRVMNGMAFGGAASTRLAYIIEITDNFSRPVFTQLGAAIATATQSLSIVPSLWLRYYGVAFLNLGYPVVFLFLLIFILPESPTFLTVKDKDKEAATVLRKLRGDDANVEEIIASYRCINEEARKVNKFKAIANKTVLSRLAIMFFLFIFYAFSGVQTFQSQAVRILIDMGSDMDATVSSFVFQLSLMTGALSLVPFAKKLGRKGCLMISFSTAAVGLLLLGTYSYFYDQMELENSSNSTNFIESSNATGLPNGGIAHGATMEELTAVSAKWFRETLSGARTAVEHEHFLVRNAWIPLVCIMLIDFAFGMGVLNLPMNLSSEYFPTVIRPQTSGMCMIFNMGLGFINLQMYSPMQEGLTMAGLLYFHSAVSCLAVPYVYFVVIETVGKDLG